jgi:hypothetical protein
MAAGTATAALERRAARAGRSAVLAVKEDWCHVGAGGADWEILVDGARFYDTRAGKGGGGAVDLVMHLWRVPFKQAVKMLREAGA